MDSCLWKKRYCNRQYEKDTYICSIHFIGNSGPTEENQDPVLATLTRDELGRKTKKRKPPVKRDILSGFAKKKKRIETDLQNDDFEGKSFQEECIYGIVDSYNNSSEGTLPVNKQS